MKEGLIIALSPVQLAAILSEQPISEGKPLQTVYGLVGALLLVADPTLASKAGEVALAAHGSDTLSAGLWQVWTAKSVDPVP